MYENFFSDKFEVKMDCVFLSAQKPKKNCQDYCLVDENKFFKYAVLSDGCGSSKDTGFGSQLLVQVTKSFLNSEKYNDYSTFNNLRQLGNDVIFKCRDIIRSIPICEECLDATLSVCIITDDKILVNMYGDGSLIEVDKKNEIHFIKTISFDGNAPFYLSYNLNEKRKKSYFESFGNQRIDFYSRNGLSTLNDVEPNLPSLDIGDLEDVSLIILTSDGIESFYNYKTGDRISSIDIAKELIDIKSKSGEFIKRRVRKIMDNFAAKDIYNSDDLSVCAILVEEK